MSTVPEQMSPKRGAKFPVPRIAVELQHMWAGLLANRAGVLVEEFLAAPDQHMNYPVETVRVELMDGSTVEFKYGFALISEEWKAVAVFTEHCGHHVLPFHEAKVFQAGKLMYSQSDA